MGIYIYHIAKFFLLKTMLFIKFIIFWNSKIYHLFSTFPKRHHARNSGSKTMIGTANTAKVIKPANPARVIKKANPGIKKKANPKDMINTKHKNTLTIYIQNAHKNSELPLSLASSACIL